MQVGENRLYAERGLEFMNAKTWDEIVQKVAQAVEKAKPGEWIIGRGWLNMHGTFVTFTPAGAELFA